MKSWKYILLVVVVLILVLFFTRLVLPSQIDDVSPGILCEDELLGLADVYYVIPKFSNVPIEKEWCESILARGKKLGMHGVYHTYEEFGVVRDEKYFGEGVDIFENCFGFAPERFKPGQLRLSSENDWIRNEVNVDTLWNQIFHKVYHCSDSGKFPNWLIRVF